jgi:hypothetical protein
MKLSHVRVLNYKCYRDTGYVPIGRAFTVLVGQNNSGKTAFLECLRPDTLQNKPHRTPAREPFAQVQNPSFELQYGLYLSGPELLHRFLSTVGGLWFPVSDPTQAKKCMNDLFQMPRISFKIKFSPGQPWVSTVSPSHQIFGPQTIVPTAYIEASQDRQSWRVTQVNADGTDQLPPVIGTYFTQSVYLFRAERMNVGESGIDGNPELAPNASNLPSVLLHLPNYPKAYDQYLEYVQEVFPSIYRVAAAPFNQGMARVTVIMNDSAQGERRPGVAVHLNDSGTGISQVLAILYVAVTAPAPRIIAVDEPNSFLHPGAAKKLLSILGRLEHQYIISTHSSEIIRAVDPEFIHLIEWEGTEAVFRTLDRANVQSQRRVLEELGVSLSDVFGADNVIWVEGPTEHQCFPLLLAHLGLLSPATVIAPLVATGDLEGRRVRANLVLEVYDRLSKGTALVPPALAISLDRETRTPSEISEMERRSNGAIKFLPRRTFENYLLDSEAITAILNDALGDKPVASGAIADWLSDARERGAYGDARALERTWSAVVDAPKVLKDLFWQFAKTEYCKTAHSVALTRWLLGNKPGHLKELFEYLSKLIKAQGIDRPKDG